MLFGSRFVLSYWLSYVPLEKCLFVKPHAGDDEIRAGSGQKLRGAQSFVGRIWSKV